MQEHKIYHLQSDGGPKSLLAEVAYASRRFFLPLQNLRDSITISKTLIATARKAFHALRDNLNLKPQSRVTRRPSREGSPPKGRDDKAARVAPLKYDPLRAYLLEQHLHEIELTFDEIEKILGPGVRLPESAELPQWWANQAAAGHPQREAWRGAGYDAFLVRGSRKVMFRSVS
jgi:hypothetical protein